jgi:hypothetical protein
MASGTTNALSIWLGATTRFIENPTLAVANTADSGPGLLRHAWLYAAGAPGPAHTIKFAIPARPQTINLLMPLPAVTDPLIALLDATQNITVASSSSTARFI